MVDARSFAMTKPVLATLAATMASAIQGCSMFDHRRRHGRHYGYHNDRYYSGDYDRDYYNDLGWDSYHGSRYSYRGGHSAHKKDQDVDQTIPKNSEEAEPEKRSDVLPGNNQKAATPTSNKRNDALTSLNDQATNEANKHSGDVTGQKESAGEKEAA